MYQKSQSSCGYYLCLTEYMQGRESNDTSLSFKGFLFSLTFTVVFISTTVNHSYTINNLSCACSFLKYELEYKIHFNILLVSI